jgi:hypothetical protein
MEKTLNVIKADIGGFVGHSNSHTNVVAKARKSPSKTRTVDLKLVFVIMPFDKCFDGVYETIKRTVESMGMCCLRADEVFRENAFVDKISNLIRSSAVIIADITSLNLNCLHEIGLAQGLGKEPILLRSDQRAIPSNLCHCDIVQYRNQMRGDWELETKLKMAINNRISPN